MPDEYRSHGYFSSRMAASCPLRSLTAVLSKDTNVSFTLNMGY